MCIKLYQITFHPYRNKYKQKNEMNKNFVIKFFIGSHVFLLSSLFFIWINKYIRIVMLNIMHNIPIACSIKYSRYMCYTITLYS